MQKSFALLKKLQDGRSHSGEALALELGVTRTAVWHHVKQLQDIGIDIHAVSGKGYRLPGGYEYLDADKIRAGLPSEIANKISRIKIEQITDSTNERLLTASAHEDVHGQLLLAEYQTAGRGRRGANWLAPPGSGLCLSFAWRFNETPNAIGALSLVIGLAVRRALENLSAHGVAVKWPNDIYVIDRTGPAKIAGILIEMRTELSGPSIVVIGLGLNLRITSAMRSEIDQRVSDMASVCEQLPGRNVTVATIITEIVSSLGEFTTNGFQAFQQEWQTADFLYGRKIKLHANQTPVIGTGLGVDENGLLKLKVGDNVQSFFAGHVELLG